MKIFDMGKNLKDYNQPPARFTMTSAELQAELDRAVESYKASQLCCGYFRRRRNGRHHRITRPIVVR